MNPLRILLVEDNRADAELIEELIKETGIGYSLIWLNDGQKALDFISSGNEFDLILLDLNVPKVNGHQVLNFLRARGICPPVPIVVLTGSASPVDLERTKENGVNCYLIKPMTVKEMERTTGTLKEIMLGQRKCNR